MSEEESNSFARMLDRRDIVNFVKEIEKYQCLYDQNSFQYANKALKRRTWLDIATKFKSNVHDCKEKWRKIRIAYMRSLKLSRSGNPPSRPYYLADYLHFISPNRNSETNDDNVPTINSPSSPASSDDSLKLEIDDDDNLENSNVADEIPKICIHSYDDPRLAPLNSEGIDLTHPSEDQYKHIIKCFSDLDRVTNESNRLQEKIMSIICPRTNGNSHDTSTPRRSFLLSLLPDIEMLDEQEMRTFRRETISLLDTIISRRNNVVIDLSTSYN